MLEDVKNKLSVAVSNNSKRPYNGELKIELVANSQNQLIQKDFSTISAIGAGAAQTLNDAAGEAGIDIIGGAFFIN